MTWINTIPYDQAEGRLKDLYERVKGPENKIDNIMLAHSLRPHSLEGHMQLYKNVLHHAGNALPAWLLETLGVYVSWLNGCAYCVDHHFQGLQRLLQDDARAFSIRDAIQADRLSKVFGENELVMLSYAETLTRNPAAVTQKHIEALRDAGFADGTILEANQVISYFAYANRTVLGLGVTTEGDILGLSPQADDDPGDWSHS